MLISLLIYAVDEVRIKCAQTNDYPTSSAR